MEKVALNISFPLSVSTFEYLAHSFTKSKFKRFVHSSVIFRGRLGKNFYKVKSCGSPQNQARMSLLTIMRGLRELYLSLICDCRRLMLALELVKRNRPIFYRKRPRTLLVVPPRVS